MLVNRRTLNDHRTRYPTTPAASGSHFRTPEAFPSSPAKRRRIELEDDRLERPQTPSLPPDPSDPPTPAYGSPIVDENVPDEPDDGSNDPPPALDPPPLIDPGPSFPPHPTPPPAFPGGQPPLQPPELRRPALSEPLPVRLAYLHAIIANTYDNVPVRAANKQLQAHLHIASISGGIPPSVRPATTLKSAKRRLRIDPDEFLDIRPICDSCFKRYTMEDMRTMAAPDCVVPKCKGKVWKTQTKMKDGRTVTERSPIKIYPYCSPVETLRRYLMRPGFASLLRDSRPDANRAALGPDDKMNDVYDGTAWREQEVGLVRHFVDGQVVDSELYRGSRKRLVLEEFGLQFALNLDW